MDESPELKWRIDAWDSLAGRAFLCRRFPEGADDPELDQSAVFVSPPFFQPEPLASRAPGLAATRGTLQSGLFIDGREAGFATLDDAIAFIRRGYNSPGSEPFPGAPITRLVGPEGRGGPGLALELPELPITPGLKDLNVAIAERMEEFTSLPDMVAPEGPAEHMDWKLADRKTLRHGRHLLSIAACELMLEILRRYPAGGRGADQAAWFDSAYRLGLQLIRLGLWDAASPICTSALEREPIERLTGLFSIDLKQYPPADVKSNPHAVLLDILFLGRKGPYWQRWELERGEETDVYDDLALFPLPRSVSHRYHHFKDSSPTVLTLLSTWFSHPISVEDANQLDRALLLFGGASVAMSALRRESVSYRPSLNNLNTQLRDAFYQRLGEAAWNWISKQLPDRAFECKLEDVLQQIPQIWTKAADAGGSHPIEGEKIEDLDPHLYKTEPLHNPFEDIDAEAGEENTAVPAVYGE
jgi:hypothetical protein